MKIKIGTALLTFGANNFLTINSKKLVIMRDITILNIAYPIRIQALKATIQCVPRELDLIRLGWGEKPFGSSSKTLHLFAEMSSQFKSSENRQNKF